MPPAPAKRSISRYISFSATERSYVRARMSLFCRGKCCHKVVSFVGDESAEGAPCVERALARIGCVVGVDRRRPVVRVTHPLLDRAERCAGGGHLCAERVS